MSIKKKASLRLKKKPVKTNPKESEIQSAILNYLETLNGVVFWRNYVGPIIRGSGYFSPNPMRGMPDIMGFTDENKAFAIEVKTKSGKLSDHQKEWIEKLESKNVFCIVARSVDDVIKSFSVLKMRPGYFGETNKACVTDVNDTPCLFDET